jgi:hypothetical protein
MCRSSCGKMTAGFSTQMAVAANDLAQIAFNLILYGTTHTASGKLVHRDSRCFELIELLTLPVFRTASNTIRYRLLRRCHTRWQRQLSS